MYAGSADPQQTIWLTVLTCWRRVPEFATTRRLSRGPLGTLLRFGALALIPVVAFGILLAYEINLDVQDRALATARSNAIVLAETGIQPLFTATMVSEGLTPGEVAQVDDRLQGASLSNEVTRLKVWNVGGTIVYSDNHALIGRAFTIDDDLHAALGGRASGGITDGHDEENSGDNLVGPLIQVYVPLEFKGTLSTVGAFEMYLPYAPVQADINAELNRLFLLLGAGLMLFYISMFPAVLVANRYRRRAEQAAITNLEVLERLNRLKTDYLIRISHQFRTAMVGIEGFSEVIREADTLNLDEVKAFASDIYNDASRLDQAFSQMLELDQMEAGRATLDLAPTDVNAILDDVAGRTRKEYPEHTIATALASEPVVALCDREKIAQVLTLVIESGVRHSPRGSRIELGAARDANAVRISVKSDARGGQDSGLGLEIARQIVDMHGGRMSYGVSPDSGSEFTFTLPLRAMARMAATC